jgi:two-component sensor histidine kinase
VIECRRKDGSVFDALVGGAVTTWEGKRAIVATVVDISDQRQTEEQLRKSKLMLQDSLAEKEVLLREIYHRTKNNMLVIISMLQLQAMDIDDARVKILFRETENRIRAMSLVHEKLYQSQNLAAIDLGEYLEGMVTALVQSMVIGDHVKVEMQCEHLSISIDNIVPLGLAINEIVTNSLQHAFKDGRQGLLYVHLRQDSSGVMEVVVGDDGAGLPEDMDLHSLRSFGMQITVNLITKQLHGTLDIARDKGTEYTIRFVEPLRPERI